MPTFPIDLSPYTQPVEIDPATIAAAGAHQLPLFPDTLNPAVGAERPDFIPSRPLLALPAEVQKTFCPELRLINAVNGARSESQHTLQLGTDRLGFHKSELETLLFQRALKMREVCEKTQTANTWETLRKIGTAILSAVSVFLGLTLFSATTPLIAGALITSGSLALANLAFTDAGLWKWVAEKLAADNEEKQKKIAALIPCVVGLTACGLGLIGFGAFAAWGALPAMPKTLTLVQTAANILTISSTVAGKIIQASVSLSQAELVDLEHQLSLHNHHVEKLSEDMEEIMKHEAESHRLAKNILDLFRQTKQPILA